MSKEMAVISVNGVVETKRKIGKNEVLRRRTKKVLCSLHILHSITFSAQNELKEQLATYLIQDSFGQASKLHSF
jgi:DNA-binding transcriptional regulator LsrR (DeoR family)